MKFVPEIKSPFFSFTYGGRDMNAFIDSAMLSQKKTTEGGVDRFEFEYALPDGLKIVQQINIYEEFDAVSWLQYFENTSASASEILSQINDCDVSFSFAGDLPENEPGYVVLPGTPAIYSTNGSNFLRNDFYPKKEFLGREGDLRYAPTGGRSSEGTLPFFDVNCCDCGVIAAVGWTGQWQARFTRNGNDLRIRTGIEEAEFRLLPGEKVRTSSVLLIEYNSGQNEGHNSLRRLIKEDYSLIGRPGRPDNGPLCAMAWGALESKEMIHRIEAIAKNSLGFETYWIDAGWYGESTGKCPNEFTGDWPLHTGNWRVNPTYHPDGLLEVSRTAAENGLKLLLWVEPERVINTTHTPREHPDWFFKRGGDDSTWLLNLGNPDALAGTVELISGFIERLGLSYYRQDFNISPLLFWRDNDEIDRRGINEIKHISGLYALWDTLLARFPGLVIDNCASGGRRIDIETLQRSIPLWRSDYQCTWDAEPEAAQIHNTGISWWIPYSGTGAGCVMGDTYRIRSCYSAAMMSAYWGYEEWEFSDSQPLNWVRNQNAEYKRVRPYFSCDYYPLVPPSLDDGGWAAWRYDDPRHRSGIVLVFRRSQSPMEEAKLSIKGLKSGCIYLFEDADTGKTFELRADELAAVGLAVHIPQMRSSKLYYYHELQ